MRRRFSWNSLEPKVHKGLSLASQYLDPNAISSCITVCTVMMRIILVMVEVKLVMMNRAKSWCHLSPVFSFISSQNVCPIRSLQNLTTEGALLFIFVKISEKTEEIQEKDKVCGESKSQCLLSFEHTPKQRAIHTLCKVDQDCEIIGLTTH